MTTFSIQNLLVVQTQRREGIFFCRTMPYNHACAHSCSIFGAWLFIHIYCTLPLLSSLAYQACLVSFCSAEGHHHHRHRRRHNQTQSVSGIGSFGQSSRCGPVVRWVLFGGTIKRTYIHTNFIFSTDYETTTILLIHW